MKIYALLVGINEYPFKPLRGCINDVTAVEKFLKETYPKKNLILKKLLNADATKQGVIEAFSLFNDAKDGDTCLFYYSGHGSYMTAAKEFWTETDGLLETLVCYDSRIGNGRDLANKELSFLIWKYSFGKQLNFVLITDSCHSGSVTRDLAEENIWRSDRTSPTRTDLTAVKDFYGFDLEVGGERGYVIENNGENTKVSVKVGNHIHLAASRDNQTAKEDEIFGVHQGIFTYSLIQTLYQYNGKINYQNLIVNTSTKVKTMAIEQDPLLDILGLDDAARQKVFLNNEVLKSGEKIYKAYYDKEKGWSINGGGANGIWQNDKVRIKDIGEFSLNSIGIDTTLFSVPFLIDLDTKKVYEARIIKEKRIPVSFAWNVKVKWSWHEDVKIIKEKAQNATDFYTVDNDSGIFVITADDGSGNLYLTNRNSKQPLFEKIKWNQDAAMDELVEKIDKVCRWYLLKDLENPKSNINENNFEINIEEIGVGKAKEMDGGLNFYYQYNKNTDNWEAPNLKISLTNKTNFAELKAKPIYLNFDYGVDTSTFSLLTLKDAPQNLFFVSENQNIDVLTLSLDSKYVDLGYNQITEYLKIFVSTKELNINEYSQEGIQLEQFRNNEDENQKSLGPPRILKEDPDKNKAIDDWQVFTVKLTVTRPTEVGLKPAVTNDILGLKIENKSNFSGKLSFSTTVELKQRNLRSADKSTLLHEQKGNDFLKPAELLSNIGQGQSLNVIEIFDAQNPNSVNYKTPLIIKPSVELTKNETIMPFGYDPENDVYFPLGLSGEEGNIIINELPPETPSDSLITKRSFTGSIKIFFYKIIGQKIGLKYEYPQLSKAKFDEGEKFEYIKDQAEITESVKNAKNIVLFIHGIIGDTEEMTKVVKRAKNKDGKTLHQAFDLVLTFDYENLNTKIEETANDLKKRLKGIELGENHGKNLVIIAHSMGGLVSRFFIEKLGGDNVVNHLIMLGTPNGGSEWADVRDLAETLISTAVNGAAFLKPWLIPLSFIGKILKGTQITLEQMNDKGKNSIIPILNDGDGTIKQTKYSIIAGNTKLIGDSAKMEASLKKIITRLKQKPAYAALDLVVFQTEPNDIAVKVKNIKMVNQEVPNTFEVASDHISYFGTAEAIDRLGRLF